MVRVEIDRRRWYRGQGPAHSRLLGIDGPAAGKMCCLGFASLALGCTEDEIQGLMMPDETLKVLPGLTKPSESYPGGVVNSTFAGIASSTNDARLMTERQREEELATEAVKAGLEFVFIN